MKHVFAVLFFILACIYSQAQLQMPYPEGEKVHSSPTFISDINHVPGEILLQLVRPGAMPQLMKELETVNGVETQIEIIGELSDIAHIWHIRFNEAVISEAEMLMAVKLNRHVREAQFNHYVELRATEPNDPQYGQQWQYDNNGANGGVVDADIDAPEAWDITTGGITADGDTIVVAIIDDGANLNHPDLQGNLWKNYAEIPGNGIDDDGNGYVDDFNGWNAQNNNGTITGGSHGTCVAGIVGAKGDNNIGVAGVNWNVKLMIIRGSSGNEATVVAAYGYALKMRKLYNQTNGAQGAFVVASNSSFGVDNGNPANFPLWCAMYDSMGVAGIVSAGATANANYNIDVTGDLPTACSSDYLISVTNVGRNDVKVTSAGYGLTTIDLGAFGQDTWTLTQNAYGAFGGTSGATPHVAGTAALMYSVPCPEFIQFAKANPGAASLQIKDWILQSGDGNASLAGITVTGKRLNTFNAVSEVLNNCGPCPLPGGLHANNITVDGATIAWNTSSSATQYILQYKLQSAGTWNEEIVNGTSFNITGLLDCNYYQFRVRSICNADSSTGYTNTFTFRTDGCCEAPLSTQVSGLTNNSAQISWPLVTAATAYNLRYRLEGSSTWTDNNGLANPNHTLNGLQTCTRYEYQIATVCNGTTTPYGSLYTFKTKGCGACEEQSYCTSFASSDFLYIQSVKIGAINNTSGDNDGYGNFINGNYAWLKADSASSITLTPTFPLFSASANWIIWIDWNQNGTFEASESAFTGSGTAAVTGTITPPSSADTGITRMRVAVAALQSPTECGDGGFGEIEDYCVRIKQSSFVGINDTKNQPAVVIFPNPASDVVNIKLSDEKYNKVELLDISGKILQTVILKGTAEQVQLSTAMYANGVYLIRLSGKQDPLIRKIALKK